MPERLQVLVEELDRLDPRDFSPASRFQFTQSRLAVRQWIKIPATYWEENAGAHRKSMARVRSYTASIEELLNAAEKPEVLEDLRYHRANEIAIVRKERASRRAYLIELNRIRHLLDEFTGQSSGVVLRDFSFVANVDIRRIIERDYRELALALLPAQCWKSAVVLAGSILEAILYDLLTRDAARVAAAEASAKAPTKRNGQVKSLLQNTSSNEWKLTDLIEVSVDLGLLLPDRSKAIDQVLRDYRNFVHPRKELKAAYPCTEAEAMLSKGALDSVCNHLE